MFLPSKHTGVGSRKNDGMAPQHPPAPPPFCALALQIELRQPKDRRSSPASFETAGLAAPSLKPPDRWRIKGWRILVAATTDFL